jgi:hypothetical protein
MITGIGDQRHAGFGDERNAAATGKALQHGRDAVSLVVVVIRHELSANAQTSKQIGRGARILGQDEIDAL